MTEGETTTGQPAPTLFTQLVMMLSTSAFQQMGKIINPMTGKTETNLKDAQAIISLIEMLETKTTGNLDDAEARFLLDTLTSLRLTFVETSKETPAPETTEKENEPEESAKDEESPDDGDEKAPKFHKKYD